jgi:hypothetical protein
MKESVYIDVVVVLTQLIQSPTPRGKSAPAFDRSDDRLDRR